MKMLTSEEEDAVAADAVDQAIAAAEDGTQAAALAQRSLVKRIVDIFAPLYDKAPAKAGFVSLQGDPYTEDNPDDIIHEAVETVKLGPNAIAKIPVTEAGLEAIEYLIAKDVPIIATEIMGVAQVISVCELYRSVAEKSGKKPPLYVTHITGIFDEYLGAAVEKAGIDISLDSIWQAGSIIARKIHRIMRERGYPGILLGGGARGLHHFTEMVGGDIHITINWQPTATELIARNPAVVNRMDTPEPAGVVEELLVAVPDFARAYKEDGLAPAEYRDFGPVEHFRNSFCAGWDYLLNAVRSRQS